MIRFAHIIFLFLLTCLTIQAQSGDPILFTVADEEVSTSEFMYIFNKNNAGSTNYSKASIREYLDLYKKFKLKVHHARALQMDTISRLKNELAGYREQLAATYLNDNSVMGRLASEAYARTLKEAEVSHILVSLPRNVNSADTIIAYQHAEEIYKTLKAGSMEFAELARLKSQDAKNKELGGYIGYIKAILPNGYYALESTIYSLEPGQISKPVRSPRGYHIVKVHSFRPAKPEIEIAHILVKKNKKAANQDEARRKIVDIHNRLVKGVPFEQIAAKESQDATTAGKGGRIGYISVGQYDPEFEKAAYALVEDGQISEPIETRVGFHVLKRLSEKSIQSFNDARRRIENELKKTEREGLAREAMIVRIKNEENLEVNEANKNKLFRALGTDVLTYRWTQPKDLEEDVLLTFNDSNQKFTSDFVKYLLKNPKERVRLKSANQYHALNALFNNFIDATCMQIEKAQLENKYPEFAALMREYEEGILLFEITKENVWDKASSDTIGLRDYFNSHRGDYTHPERAIVTMYTLSGTDLKGAKKLVKKFKKLNNDQIKSAYPNIPQDEDILDRRDESGRDVIWKVGKFSPLSPLGNSGTAFTVSRTNKIIAPKNKELKECRGYVIADYQDQLEKNWIDYLQRLYPVKENQMAVQKLMDKPNK
jgi:peptidyl-prolyl cis-trans isomerase SurA